ANHTSSFDLQIDQLRVDYSNKFDWYSVNAEVMWDLTDVIQTVEFLSYSHKTTEAANTILEIWDFTDTEWDLVNSSTNTNGFYDTQFDLSNSRYRDGSDNVKVRYRTAELMETPFNLLIDRLKVDYTTVRDAHKIDFEVIWDITDVTFNLMEFIKYSHKTNVSIDIDVDIYNYTSQTWYEIESVINSQTFDDDSFALSSDFYNSSNHVRLRFQSDSWETFTEEGFKLLLDRLTIDYEYHNTVYGHLGDNQYFSFIADNEVYNVSMYYLDGQNKIFIAYMEPDPSNPNRFEYTWNFIQSTTGALTNDDIDIIFYLKDIFNNTNEIRYRFIANFESPVPTISLGNGSQDFENNAATPLTALTFDSDEIMEYGMYYGTHDFKYELGEIELDIDFVDTYYSAIGTSVSIIPEFDGHKNVLQMEDNNNTGRAYLYHTFSSSLDNSIEFWLGSSWNASYTYRNGYLYFDEVGSGGNLAMLVLSGSAFRYYNGATDITISTFTNNTLYHIRLDFDDTTNTYDVYVNGVLEVSGIAYLSSSTNGVNRLRLYTRDFNSGYKIYFDAIGFTSDTISHNGLGYKTGYNINPFNLEPMLEQKFSTSYLDFGEYVKISDVDGQQNVLEIFAPSGQHLYISKQLDDLIVGDGSVLEWSWRVDTLGYTEVQIVGDGGIAPYLIFNGNGDLIYYDGSNHVVETGLVAGRWYKHKIVINFTSNSFDWYVDDELKQANCNFYYSSSSLNNVKYHSSAGTTAYYNVYPENEIAKEEYRIINFDTGSTTPWKEFNSSLIKTINDLEVNLGTQFPINFIIEYRTTDISGNQGTTTTYNRQYETIYFSREVQISLSDDTIDLNGFNNREISFQDTGQFNNTQFLDVLINGFNYGTAYLDNGFYKLSFGTENSMETLIGYSESIISDYIYSNINPLSHVSWETKDSDFFGVVKHVLVDGDITIINPLTYNTTSTLELAYLYDRGFILENYARIQDSFYYNATSEDNEIVNLNLMIDYVIDNNGVVTFPEDSLLLDLYNNPTEVEDGLIYFNYAATYFYDQMQLSNADGFFINFTMPSVYYDHTTIEKLTINFNDFSGKTYSKIYWDIDLREFFLESVKDQYEGSIFGLGQMMTIPLYIDINELAFSNPGNIFDFSLLESISFTISDSERWPGSFIQDIGNYSVMNLPYQRVGLKDLKLYNLISDSIEVDEQGFVNSTVVFKAPDYNDFFAQTEFKIKRLDVEFTELKVFLDNQRIDISLSTPFEIEYSDFLKLNYRFNNSLSPVILNDIYNLPVNLINASSSEVLSFGSASWVTKLDIDSLSGYYTKYYYSRFQAPLGLGEFNVSISSFGTPIFNISFTDASPFTLNITQEVLSSQEPIYLEADTFELEYGDSLILRGAVLDNDEYIIEDVVYNYYYQEAIDGESVVMLDFESPFGDDGFIDKQEFAFYYLNNDLEKVPIYSTLNGEFYKDNSILEYNINPEINYVDNTFLLNIHWKKNAINFINYDTVLLVSYKVLKGRPISPSSFSSLDSYGNDRREYLVEIPFARYDMINRSWITEDDFIEEFIIDKKLLYEDIESTEAIIEGPVYYTNQLVQTGIIYLDRVYVNDSSSGTFELLNESLYSWEITSNGDLNVSSL
ncbi:hypothetical protein LCGC14_1305950, partial [marine sediment metagenome]